MNSEFKPSSAVNISSVIQAHTAWKRRIDEFIKGDRTEALSFAEIAKDNVCVLGKWIYGEGERSLSGDLTFQQLKAVHADFHLQTGKIVQHLEMGEEKEASDLLISSAYRRVSNDCVSLLTKLYKQSKS